MCHERGQAMPVLHRNNIKIDLQPLEVISNQIGQKFLPSQKHFNWMIIFELHPELVFFGRYRSVFLGMYDTITEGNLGQYVCSRGTYMGMTPFHECRELQLGSRAKQDPPGRKIRLIQNELAL
jgi:hypothetical protein